MNNNSAIVGYSNNTGVYGSGSTTGVQGESNATGVAGLGAELGVYGYSYAGTALLGYGYSGVPLHLNPTAQPTTGTRRQGDMYVDLSGNLHIWNGIQWRTVTTTAG